MNKAELKKRENAEVREVGKLTYAYVRTMQAKRLRLFEILLDAKDEYTEEQTKLHQERYDFWNRDIDVIMTEEYNRLDFIEKKVIDNLMNDKIFDEVTGECVTKDYSYYKDMLNGFNEAEQITVEAEETIETSIKEYNKAYSIELA